MIPSSVYAGIRQVPRSSRHLKTLQTSSEGLCDTDMPSANSEDLFSNSGLVSVIEDVEEMCNKLF